MDSDPNVVLVAPPTRPCSNNYVSVTRLPTWVPFIIGSVMRGDSDYGEALNAISLTTDGNLLLYRKIDPSDWVMFPELLSASEVWVELNIDPDVI